MIVLDLSRPSSATAVKQCVEWFWSTIDPEENSLRGGVVVVGNKRDLKSRTQLQDMAKEIVDAHTEIRYIETGLSSGG